MKKPRTYKEAYIILLRKYNKLKSENERLKARLKQFRKPEFSKGLMKAVMTTYFVGLGFGIYAVNKILTDYPEWAIQALISMFGYIAAPVGVAIGFYSWKAKNENVPKIERGMGQDEEKE